VDVSEWTGSGPLRETGKPDPSLRARATGTSRRVTASQSTRRRGICAACFPGRSSGVRTDTAMIFLPMSIAATRSYTISTAGSLRQDPIGADRGTRMRIKSLRLALERRQPNRDPKWDGLHLQSLRRAQPASKATRRWADDATSSLTRERPPRPLNILRSRRLAAASTRRV
jgi:hypothetical protein